MIYINDGRGDDFLGSTHCTEFLFLQSTEQIDEEAGMDQPRHPHIEAAGREKNARGQHRLQLKTDGERNSAEGFQPWSLVGNTRRIVGNARRTALTKPSKKGPAPLRWL